MLMRIVLGLMLALTAQAEEAVKGQDNAQQLGRRPYAAATVKAPETLEGNTATTEEAPAERRYKTLQLHNLGRRGYAEKSAD